MKAEIISVGTELLLGDIVNTNAQFLAKQLALLGVSVFYQTVVGDNHGRLVQAVCAAAARSDILLLTGGLGPTEDDLTKQAVADAFGCTLVPDTEELAKLQGHFAAAGQPMPQNNRKQADVPLGGFKLPNANGTAPGVVFEKDGKMAILLPGPPKEMQPMFLNQVLPLLQKGQNAAMQSLTLHVFGIGESKLETLLGPLLQQSNPTAALYSKTTEVYIRITARAKTEEQAKEMCEKQAEEFYAILGGNIYSSNGLSLQGLVVQLLCAAGKKVATAESCTGGMLSGLITSVPGASNAFGFGLCCYANSVKMRFLGVQQQTLEKQGAVSAQTACQMARGALLASGANYALATTGVAGPGGGSDEKPVGLVYIALACGGRVHVKKMQSFSKNRDIIRRLACLHALDLLRRLIQGLALPETEVFDSV